MATSRLQVLLAERTSPGVVLKIMQVQEGTAELPARLPANLSLLPCRSGAPARVYVLRDATDAAARSTVNFWLAS